LTDSSFSTVDDFLQHGWQLLQDFYEWQLRRGRPAGEAGTVCKNLAYFQELFLARFCFHPRDCQVALDQIGTDTLDGYLGGWYLTDSGIASPEDLDRQLGGFRLLFTFFREEDLYRGTDAMRLAAEHALDDLDRYHRRLHEWEVLRGEASQEADWIQRREHWLASPW
jgi:hypothetical protein